MAKNDDGWEDLFAPLADDDGAQGAGASDVPAPSSGADAAPAFPGLEGYTAATPAAAEPPVELEVPDVARPEVASGQFDTGFFAADEFTSVDLSETGAALTRRELRELRRQVDGAAESEQSELLTPSAPIAAGEPPAAPQIAPVAPVDPVSPIPPVAAPAENTTVPEPAFSDADLGAPVEPVAPAAARPRLPELDEVAPEGAWSFAADEPAVEIVENVRVIDDGVEPLAPTAAFPAAAAAAAVQRRDAVELIGGEGFPIRLQPRQGAGGGAGRGGSADRFAAAATPPPPRRPRRSLKWLAWFVPLVLILGGLVGAGAWAWNTYEEQIREVLGIAPENDYEGTGNGTEVIIPIVSGETGTDIASTLASSGVTMTFDAFYDLLLTQDPEPVFQAGNYRLQEQMSAQAALDALLDPANKLTNQLLVTEGTTLPAALELMSATTGLPLEQFQAAASNPQAFGAGPEATTLEGYLFPATYELDGTETAESLIQRMVNEMFTRLDALGVAPEDRYRVLTMASIVQREAGSNLEDFGKVARVFQNRLDSGWNLESDATVSYGTGNFHSVWTTPEERADASNLYNTYANSGLPVGPIGLPGEVALQAVVAPIEGPWYFFVTVNLATGETVFSETLAEHEAAVAQLQEWCATSDEDTSRCADR